MTYLVRLVKARSRLQAAILITGNLLVLAELVHVDAEVVAVANAAVAAWLLVASSVLTGEGLEEITAEVDRRVAAATAARGQLEDLNPEEWQVRPVRPTEMASFGARHLPEPPPVVARDRAGRRPPSVLDDDTLQPSPVEVVRGAPVTGRRP